MRPISIPTSNEYSQWYNEPFYVDKTWELLNIGWALKRWSALFFARPRRWWKSLFFSMINHLLNKDLYKKEYFEWKKVTQSERLMKMAWKYFTLSLDLKPLYDKDTDSLKWDKLWNEVYEQLPEEYLEEYYWIEKTNNKLQKRKNIELLKNENWNVLWAFIKDFVESYSKQQDILLLVDEYDKPVSDCLKTYKNEHKAYEILEELKDEFYTYANTDEYSNRDVYLCCYFHYYGIL